MPRSNNLVISYRNLTREEVVRVANECLEAFRLNFPERNIAYDTVWWEIFIEAARLYDCIRRAPRVYSHLLYQRSLRDLNEEILPLEECETLEPWQAYSVGPESSSMCPETHYCVAHPFRPLLLYQPRFWI